MDCGPLGASVQGISQARILEWVANAFCRGSSWVRVKRARPEHRDLRAKRVKPVSKVLRVKRARPEHRALRARRVKPVSVLSPPQWIKTVTLS